LQYFPRKPHLHFSSFQCILHILLISCSLICWRYVARNKKSRSSSLGSFLQLPCYFLHLRPKCLPQYANLEHPQYIFSPQCVRPSVTPTQNKRQDQCFFTLQSSIFDIAYGRKKDSELNGSKHSLNLICL
jgi:hypothetical protein